MEISNILKMPILRLNQGHSEGESMYEIQQNCMFHKRLDLKSKMLLDILTVFGSILPIYLKVNRVPR